MRAAPGQRLRIRAADWNGLLDMLARERSAGRWRSDAVGMTPPSQLYVRASSSVPMCHVVGIGPPAVMPADNLDDFRTRPVLTTAAVVANAPYGVTQEPISAGLVGTVMLCGVTAARIIGTVGAPPTAAPDPGTGRFRAGPGPAVVLWADAGSDERWAVLAISQMWATGAAFAIGKIVARSGTVPPYVYSAVEAEHTGTGWDDSDFSAKPGGRSWSFNVINLQEIGESGFGVRGIEIGSIVQIWPFVGGYSCFSASHYRGTYG